MKPDNGRWSNIAKELMRTKSSDVDAMLLEVEDVKTLDDFKEMTAGVVMAMREDVQLRAPIPKEKSVEDLRRKDINRWLEDFAGTKFLRTLESHCTATWVEKKQPQMLEAAIQRVRDNGYPMGAATSERYYTLGQQLSDIYQLPKGATEMLQLFIQQSLQTEATRRPSTTVSLYLWGEQKRTGKTTFARILCGILNGAETYDEIKNLDFSSTIAEELQFSNFSRPKGTYNNAVLLDEAFNAAKGTRGWYAKFKASMTEYMCDVEIKYGGKFPVNCRRNYVFTSNNPPTDYVADETERRVWAIEFKDKPTVKMSEEALFTLVKEFVNCVSRDVENVGNKENMSELYPTTGAMGEAKDDVYNYLCSAEFSAYFYAAAPSQLTAPAYFTRYLAEQRSYHVDRKVVMDIVAELFGKPKRCGRRCYYNKSDVSAIVGQWNYNGYFD